MYNDNRRKFGGASLELVVVLAQLKYLVSKNQFQLVNRRAHHAQAVTTTLAKVIVNQLSTSDFQKYEEDRDRPKEYVWVFVTDYGDTYYIKFKFINNTQMVRFISFHLAD
ncbi:toxin-antitoxin system, toxin component [Lentilactobacillus kisonensis DSM 19906 = JCM 15041]|uniref:Toxin-antitoxin system, toxin component n=3 Tax=Lentilactobacillus kisonensis TaxID=481722 RepID=A0A0R1NQW4_9LACO|nr:putative toxin-antitoxin system, toxin component [Lentilactobacillus kisonensis F0435]KRL22752.1 toxin-antitoxin system, toxin component [Lentilactobacillus kisonensis DSM 19906 = JCM 15041]